MMPTRRLVPYSVKAVIKNKKIKDHKNPGDSSGNKALIPAYRSSPVLAIILVCFFLSASANMAFAEKNGGPLQQFELSRHSKLLKTIHSPEAELEPFVTDGCSGGLSVGWNYISGKIDTFEDIHGTLPPWESCCVTHDKVYHSGALRDDTKQMSFNRRKEADTALKQCVIDTGMNRTPELLDEYAISAEELNTIYHTIAELMYRAVRIGGMPCSGLPWRWGFGWQGCL